MRNNNESASEAFVRANQERIRRTKAKVDVELVIDESQVERELKKVVEMMDRTFSKLGK